MSAFLGKKAHERGEGSSVVYGRKRMRMVHACAREGKEKPRDLEKETS